MTLEEKIAREAFDGKFRRDGITPYVVHMEFMTSYLKTMGYPALMIAVAWLHDYIEDGLGTEQDLRNFGVSEEVIAGIKILTHNKGETYENYIRRVMRSLFLPVKIADLLDNLSSDPTERQLKKYKNALRIIMGKIP